MLLIGKIQLEMERVELDSYKKKRGEKVVVRVLTCRRRPPSGVLTSREEGRTCSLRDRSGAARGRAARKGAQGGF